jgi:hypothetical protein
VPSAVEDETEIPVPKFQSDYNVQQVNESYKIAHCSSSYHPCPASGGVIIASELEFLNSCTNLNWFRKILNSRPNCSFHVPPPLEKPALWLLFAGVKPVELFLRLISRAGRAPLLNPSRPVPEHHPADRRQPADPGPDHAAPRPPKL